MCNFRSKDNFIPHDSWSSAVIDRQQRKEGDKIFLFMIMKYNYNHK